MGCGMTIKTTMQMGWMRRAVSVLAMSAAIVVPNLHAAELTIDDGVVVKFGADAGVVVRDTLRTSGATTFTSVKDDSVGGQTGGAAQTPAAGDWRGIKFEASSTNVRLDEASVRYAGGNGEAGVSLRRLSPTLRYLSVENSALGMRVEGGSPRLEGVSLVGNTVGLEVDANAAPTIVGGDLHGNTQFGVRNLTPATVIPATGNWWGHLAGPTHATNPSGQGDAVTDGVNFGGFLIAAPLQNPLLRVAGNVTYTESRDITLFLACRNAVEYRVAEGGNFTGVGFQPMTGTVPFTLSAGDGVKSPTVQYRNVAGQTVTASLPAPILYDVAGPTLAITNPAPDSYINNSITLSATATDPAGVARVEFYVDDILVSTDTAAPYSYAWDVNPVENGAHAIRVVAVDAIGHTSTQTNNITLAKALPPPPDTEGPALASLSLGGTAITTGSTLTRSGSLTVSATDRSGVSRIDFYLDGTFLGSDTSGGDGYSAFVDLYSVTDGAHTVRVRAFDSLNNATDQTTSVTVALAPPPAPTLTAPANNSLTNLAQITVSGTAERQTTVSIYSNGTVIAGAPIAVDSAGRFSASVAVGEGANRLRAAATNRGGTGPQSGEVLVTVDTAIPAAPLGLNAIAQASGRVRLTWNRSLDSKVTGYHLYRSSQAFNAITEAVKVTTNPIAAATTLYDDLPATDGTYYYRLIAVNGLGTPSQPSNQVSGVSDNTLPRALNIAYAPTGQVDAATGRIAVGRVDVTITVSEPLGADPFLSIAPNNGIPLAVDLVKTDDTHYSGSFTITSSTPSGQAFAVFSARDVVGNRGTDVVAGQSILIDAQGPTLTALTLNPTTPIRNDATAPTAVTATITLNEAIKTGQTPQLSYVLSGTPTTQTPITGLTQTGTLTWAATFTLPTTAGATQSETLTFSYTGLDDLDNSSSTITAGNSFQVYQGELPSLTSPLDFTALAQPAGRVKLAWRAVDTAVAYQIYRQAPGDGAPSEYQRITNALEYIDATTVDGLYRYSIASIRSANGQESLSPQSNLVSVTADSVPPDAPGNLALILIGSGIQATWTAPAGTPATYNLYRSSAATITTVEGLTPIRTRVTQLGAIDSNPNLNEHAYAATALDAAGNESAPSTSVYLNFALVPVGNLTVVQDGATLPIITWTHNGSGIAGYDVYLGPDATREKLNLTPLTERAYTDTGYANDERRYTVVVFDNTGANIARSITLPKLEAKLIGGTPLKRGVMNLLTYQVTNSGTQAVNGARVKAHVGVRETLSDLFSINAGETKSVNVVVGGFADIPSQTTLTTTVDIVPNEGERIQIARTQTVEAIDGALVLSVAPQDFTRGVGGKVRFTLENTSDTDLEILTATNQGKNVSSDIRFKLLDKDGNVITTQSFRQALGANVITLASGQTVARLTPRATFTSDLTDVSVPSSAPNEITVQVDIDRLHYRLGSPEGVSIPGLNSRRAASLLDTAYYGEVTNITPTSSFGDQNVVITGRAIARATTQPLGNVPLKLILNVNGFERKFDLYTDSTGAYTHTFTPTASDGGVYIVSILHPDMFERPNHGQFVINSVGISPTLYKLTNARNYPFTIKFRAQAGEGTQATNLRVVYDAQQQPGGTFPTGVTVNVGTPINLASRQTVELPVTVTGGNDAAETGVFNLRVLADERGTEPLANIRVEYRFTNATPALAASPSYVETGLAQGGAVIEQVFLENRGFAEATGVTATLLNTDGTPAPDWLFLQGGNQLGTLVIGEKRTIDIAISPPAAMAEGIYSYMLRVASSNAQGGEVPIYVSITQSGIGNVLFKASDIYTGTLNTSGQRIAGLQGARITLQNEQVVSVTQTITTDALGEAYFTDLPSGRYKFRATATNHQEVIGRVTIKPGITATQDVFLDYNLVTVEWSVTEITIQDKYEINLVTTFQTDVPAAVVVMEPSSVTLPTMQAGDVYYGELTITNYGLIRAENAVFTPPVSDGIFRFEFLTEVPAVLEAKQRVTIPYRVVSLTSLDQPTATGGGCGTVQRTASIGCTYTCVNGTQSRTGSSTSWFYVYGSCSSGGGSSGGGGGTGGGGFGGGGGGVFGGGSPSYTSLPGAPCVPGPGCSTCACSGNRGGGDGPRGPGSGLE